MNGLEIVRGLIDRGYSPHAAAALAGHMLQESGGNPSALNKGEGANGLMQWRLDRWDNLQQFAKDQGKSPNDPNVQLDFVGKELAGPEKKAGAAFLSAPDLPSASAALKPYIRFGDNSADARLNNAASLYNQLNGDKVGSLATGAAPVDPVSAINPTSTVTDIPAAGPGAPAPSALDKLASALNPAPAQGGQAAAPAAPEYAPLQNIQMPQPMAGQSQQIAQAIAKMYGIA